MKRFQPLDPGARKACSDSYLLEENDDRTVKKMQRQKFLKNYHKIDGKFSRQRCLDPDPDSVLKKIMDPDPICPERFDPDPVNIRPDPKP